MALKEYQELKSLVSVVCNGDDKKANRERIFNELEKCEIQQIYSEEKARLGYGYCSEIKEKLATDFHKSIKTIEKILYH